jgi:hypothetical protein
MTPRDMCRIGLLLASDGYWNGQKIITKTSRVTGHAGCGDSDLEYNKSTMFAWGRLSTKNVGFPGSNLVSGPITATGINASGGFLWLNGKPVKLSVTPYPVKGQAFISVNGGNLNMDRVEICDLAGSQIKELTIINGKVVKWDSNRISNGIYLLKAIVNRATITRRIAVLK